MVADAYFFEAMGSSALLVCKYALLVRPSLLSIDSARSHLWGRREDVKARSGMSSL